MVHKNRNKNKSKIPVFLLVSLVFFVIISLVYSKYMVKTDLRVEILNQTSSCYAGQDSSSNAKWSKGNILMETTFEAPDPCYKIDSVKAIQQGDRVEVKIKTISGGICTQCFGFKKLGYEILLPKIENSMNIYVDIEGITKQYVRLPLAA